MLFTFTMVLFLLVFFFFQFSRGAGLEKEAAAAQTIALLQLAQLLERAPLPGQRSRINTGAGRGRRCCSLGLWNFIHTDALMALSDASLAAPEIKRQPPPTQRPSPQQEGNSREQATCWHVESLRSWSGSRRTVRLPAPDPGRGRRPWWPQLSRPRAEPLSWGRDKIRHEMGATQGPTDVMETNCFTAHLFRGNGYTNETSSIKWKCYQLDTVCHLALKRRV